MAIKRDLLVDKLLDKKFYNTVYLSKIDEEKANTEHVEALVELLCDVRYKSSKQDVYKLLQSEPKAVELLMRAIIEAKGDKKTLVATCWESNINCTPFLALFTEIVIRDEFEVAMEAITVIEQISGDVTGQLANELILRVKENYSAQANIPKGALLRDLVDLLSRWV